jgi:hypothetical protein
VQVTAVDHQVREPVPPFHVAQIEPGQDTALDGVLHDDVLRQHAERPHLAEQSPGVEDPGAVGSDLHPGADLTEP